MNRIPLKAQEREILGKKVKRLRRDGLLPAHVFGKKVETEHVSVNTSEFLKVYNEAGETGLVDLTIGAEKVRPVLIRDVQVDPVKGSPLHIDFYQVNLMEKVAVPVPVVLEGEEPELVHKGEAVVIQPMNEVEVEALPTELPDQITVSISDLKEIGDAILVSTLKIPQGVTVLADPEAVVVKLDTAVTEEMKKLMEEQAAEQAAVAAEAAEEAGEAPAEGEEGAEAVPAGRQGEEKVEGEEKAGADEAKEEQKESSEG